MVPECKKGGTVHDDQKGNKEKWHDLQMQEFLLREKKNMF
jgi:hypothetical protein